MQEDIAGNNDTAVLDAPLTDNPIDKFSVSSVKLI